MTRPNDDDRDTQSAELLRRARHGDRDAFDQLFARNVSWLRSTARHRRLRLDPSRTTADFVATAFQRAWAHHTTLPEDVSGFRRWLARTLLNRVHDAARHSARRPPTTVSHLPQDIPSDATSLTKVVALNEDRERLAAAIAELQPVDRRIMDLAAQGQTNAAIAAHLGMSMEAVKKRRQRIGARLGDAWSDA